MLSRTVLPLLGLLLCSPSPAHAGPTEAHAYARQIGTDAYVLMIDGQTVDSFGKLDAPYRLHSIRKSLLSILIGQAYLRREIDPTKPVSAFGIHDYVDLNNSEAGATVLDLMRSASGIYRTAVHENIGWDDVRPERGSYRPGEHWFYSNWDFNTLGTIYQSATRRSICRDLLDRLVAPLGMKDFRRKHCAWRYSERSQHPAYVFRMSARDLARIGQLYLDEGAWRGRQLVPSDWVAYSTQTHSAATRPDGSPMPGVGYGLMWWTYEPATDFHGLNLGKRVFYASGSGGQYLIVAPELNLVFVHRNDTDEDSESYKSIGEDEVAHLLALLLD